jgi:hypothetical protein
MNTTGRYAFAGYVADVFQIASFRFSNPHSLMKFFQIDALRKRTGATQFIEAGTYLGLTAERCSRTFQKVYTIELDPQLVRKASLRLKRHKNIELIEGDASICLEQILQKPEVDDVVIFWDGHACGAYAQSGDTAPDPEIATEPVMSGLTRVFSWSHKIKGIIVDDFRLFGEQEGFPTKAELIGLLEKFGRSIFEVSVHLDQVILARKQTASNSSQQLH